MNPITISSQFDSGAIDVVRADDPADIELKVRADNAAEFAQWFHFRLQGAAGTPVTLRFSNAGQCAYPKGWEGYQAVASHDRQHWQRVPTRFDGVSMTVQFTPATNSVYLAYFEPYSWERHLDLIGSAAASDHVQVERLGATLDGRDIDVLHITDAASAVKDADKRQIWLIARQHPGETMAEWFIEGLLERLLDAADPVARVLLARCVFHVVPNMNPDGSVRGNLRTNGAGANLNREWLEPALDRSPEVLLVRRCMQRTGHRIGVGPFQHGRKTEALCQPLHLVPVTGARTLRHIQPERGSRLQRARLVEDDRERLLRREQRRNLAEARVVVDQPGGVGLRNGQQIAGAVAFAQGAQFGQALVGARLVQDFSVGEITGLQADGIGVDRDADNRNAGFAQLPHQAQANLRLDAQHIAGRADLRFIHRQTLSETPARPQHGRAAGQKRQAGSTRPAMRSKSSGRW